MITELFDRYRVIAVVDMQWGDTGKGKLVDALAEQATCVIRGTGGANAGHTIVINGKKYVFHLLPAGILHDEQGTVNVIGPGVAGDAAVILEELEALWQEGKTAHHLMIDVATKLVLPHHMLFDLLAEQGANRIGTTLRGIGPCYADHYQRLGLVMNDLMNIDVFAAKLKRMIAKKQAHLASVDPELLRTLMHHERLQKGRFYHPIHTLDADEIIACYRHYGEKLRPFIRDTRAALDESAIARKRVLLEGAQGLLLSIDYGTYPYVTASDPSLEGLAKGAGMRSAEVDLTLCVAKAPYMTRVGDGPFPTELGGKMSEVSCGRSDMNRDMERALYPDASVNSTDEFLQGIALRQVADEYGATTGRPRRTGWLDLPLLRYAYKLTDRQCDGEVDFALTRLDTLDDCASIKICNQYIYRGPLYHHGTRTLKEGDIIETALPDPYVLAHCEPVYTTLPGWKSSIRGIQDYEALPSQARSVVEYIQKSIPGSRTACVSTGPDRYDFANGPE